ncbi:hypothetical protein ATCV1_z207R [Acanthocystis turfacea chlorella virus 1]|uniref:Uncharacterized protein z207R n=1 Tax=Chlorovirus heliozoae TaxID=322019 RepID=A7K8G7_9PHYC|nr:hypothetical protein ATCV1_z207R [Acanthocystis turfacea chlorella virus 1]ABT16341.1 hypothetical protein ATCV1_z207R [Acanthocystis turfacea chlorella virus 1]
MLSGIDTRVSVRTGGSSSRRPSETPSSKATPCPLLTLSSPTTLNRPLEMFRPLVLLRVLRASLPASSLSLPRLASRRLMPILFCR